jgi:phosphate-selective porin OprO/OprP
MIGGLIRDKGRYLLSGASVIAVLAMCDQAKAQDNQAIQAQIQALQSQINGLQRQVEQAQAAAASAQKSSSDDLDLKVKWKGAPEFSSSDGRFKMKVRGRLQADYNGINQDRRITGEEDVSAVELRRARLGVEGVVYYNWIYKFEIDFAGDASEIKDAYIAYSDWGPESWETSEILAGNFKVPNSLEELTSSRFITFMERAAFTDAFFLDRQIGAGVNVGSEHWSLRGGYFGAESGTQETFFDDSMAAAIRGTLAPINNDTMVTHFGASYRHRNAGTSRDTAIIDPFEYRARGADLHLADRFIDTPFIGKSDELFVLEGALVWKSLSVQGEYAQLKVDIPPAIANVSPTYDGYYVDAMWFITGEMRNYEADVGEFGRTKVKNPVFGGSGGSGAWQLAGRYDVLDLGDKAAAITNFGVVTCTECGEQKTWIVALNWWLTDYTALKFQYSESDIEGGVNNGAEIKGFGMRAQVDW